MTAKIQKGDSMIARVWRAMLAAAPVTFWGMLGGGIVVTALFTALVLIVWLGGWPSRMAEQQLAYLGLALLACAILMGLVMVRLTGTSVKGRLGGNEIEMHSDNGERRD